MCRVGDGRASPGRQPIPSAALACLLPFLDENGTVPVRILTTANHLDSTGGLGQTQQTPVQGLNLRGHRSKLVDEGGDPGDRRRDHTVTVRRISSTRPRRAAPLHSSRNVAEARRAARKLEPDQVDLREVARLSALERRQT
jgi:hypothetical protein